MKRKLFFRFVVTVSEELLFFLEKKFLPKQAEFKGVRSS